MAKVKKTKYPALKDGEWVWPKMSGYKMECCDCGLIHKLDFIVVAENGGDPINGAAVVFRAYRKKRTVKR